MGSAEEWARSLKASMDAKQAESNRAVERVTMNRNIVAEQMPVIWDSLLAEFANCCKAFNEQIKPERELALHRTGSHDFMVRPDAMEEIVRGHYFCDLHHISIITKRGTELFVPGVLHVGTGKVFLVSSITQSETSLESIARNAITGFAL